MDTIIALSSGDLPSGVAIIRLSGPQATFALNQLGIKTPLPRIATYASVFDLEHQVIDQGLCLWFPAPYSFTGEDVVELQLHGSRAVVAKILDVCTSMDGVRMAEAGEFARRAFANGKIDLTEAEGLADLIDAETEAQRRVAQHLASGGLKQLYNAWQDQLLTARAMIEADIDFADEDDVPGSVADQIWTDMDNLLTTIKAHLADYRRGERIRKGFKISLIGKPNVGKSSLLNALAGSDRAIVSPEAGTTRDIVEVRLDIGGYLVLLSDTAGIRGDADGIESEGIRRSFEAASNADLILLLSHDGDWSSLAGHDQDNIVKVRSKADSGQSCTGHDVTVSVSDSSVLDCFISYIVTSIEGRMAASLAANSIRERYVAHLMLTVSELEKAVSTSEELEIRAEHLRSAAYSLGRITGQHDTEDILGKIFSSFCIGK